MRHDPRRAAPYFAAADSANNMLGQAAAIVSSTATAIWARELDIMHIAAGRGVKMAEVASTRARNHDGTDAYMELARKDWQSTVDDLWAIADLTFDCGLRLADLYSRAWREHPPAR